MPWKTARSLSSPVVPKLEDNPVDDSASRTVTRLAPAIDGSAASSGMRSPAAMTRT